MIYNLYKTINIKGSMSQGRKSLVREAFRRMDKNGDGTISVEDVRNIYDASRHPDVVRQVWMDGLGHVCLYLYAIHDEFTCDLPYLSPPYPSFFGFSGKINADQAIKDLLGTYDSRNKIIDGKITWQEFLEYYRVS